MKFSMNKGRWIYLIVLIINIAIMFTPHSTSLFKLSVENADAGFQLVWLADLIAITVTILGYFTIRMFYKRQARYAKNYPYLILVIALGWTVVTQIK